MFSCCCHTASQACASSLELFAGTLVSIQMGLLGSLVSCSVAHRAYIFGITSSMIYELTASTVRCCKLWPQYCSIISFAWGNALSRGGSDVETPRADGTEHCISDLSSNKWFGQYLPVDFLTKPLSEELLVKLRKKVMGW